MHQPSEDWRSQDYLQTDSQPLEEKNFPESTRPMRVPVSQNTPVGPITRQLSRSLDDVKHVKAFFYKERIGSETRTMEFKRGLGQFDDNVRRYACAFLNTVGGRLMLGVDDDGYVLGNKMDFRERDRRYGQKIDEILKNFKPPVMPGSYSVDFLPVRPGDEDGCQLPGGGRVDFTDLTVLCLSLTPPPVHRQTPMLYQTDKNKVFIRRDGKVEEMNAGAINEWYLQMWSSKVERKSRENDRLKGIIKELRTRQERSQSPPESYSDYMERYSDYLDSPPKYQESPPNHQKRKMAEPVSEESAKKWSPTTTPESKSGEGDYVFCGLKKFGDAEVVKESELQRLTREVLRLTNENERLSRQQESSQDGRVPLALVSSNTVKPTEGKRRPAGDKRRRNPPGGAEQLAVGSDGREVQDKLHQMNLR